ncbi:Multidrug resistance-associated protein 1 [Linnemannia exigua]|uniref:Multidrug resistance-associated protein 1 n=1 Tax=Linnemannia exigua TaxID=604196 RepID=A0AAD4D4Z3_9FUNG|nr:Multidrug resistance-associated protein 1 [Linnemannia exigua]
MTIVCLLSIVGATINTSDESGASSALQLGYMCFSIAWCVALVLNREEHRHCIRSSDRILCFYIWSIVALSLIIHTLVKLGLTNGPRFAVTVAILIFTFLGFFVEACPRGPTRVQRLSNASPYDKANLISRLSIFYVQPLISLAVRRTLTPNDLVNQMPGWMREKAGWESLETQWNRNVAAWSSPSLVWAVFRVQAICIAPMYFLRIVASCLMFTMPLLLSRLLESLQEANSGGQTKINLVYGLELTWAMFAASLTGTILKAVTRQTLIMQGLQTKIALTGMIYKKALKLSPGARNKSTAGEIVNHMSVDADVWQDGLYDMSNWVTLPIEIGAAMWLSLLLIAPLQVWRAQVYNGMLKNKLTVMDERVRLTTEILAAIKIVKLYGWESPFKQRILDARDRELLALKSLGVIFAIMSIVFTSATLIMSLLTLSVYAAWGGEGFSRGELTPQTVFVSMTLFSMLRTPIGEFSETVSHTIGLVVSSNRIKKFLLLEEVDESNVLRDPQVPADPTMPTVTIENGSFSWTKDPTDAGVEDHGTENNSDESTQPLLPPTVESTHEPESTAGPWRPTLQNINLSMTKGSLTAVVGRIGQGKSSLLNAILGEMYTLQGRVSVRGRIAYVPQHAWILNASVMDNILFGQPYDDQRYQQILYSAGLGPDLAILPAGDQTEIGERGINLSGGQKQRVSLARAAYADADIYLLDDPLSAVDAHVDRHLWKQLLGPEGMLKDKTRILVTHGIHHLKEVDNIVLVKDGEVAENGTYGELMARRSVFYQLIQEYSVSHRRAAREGNLGSTGTALAESTSTDSALSGSDGMTVAQTDESASCLESDGGDDSSLSGTIGPSGDIDTSGNKKDFSDGKLVVAEVIKEGAVKFSVCVAYIRAASFKLAGLVVLFHVISYTCLVATNLWLKYCIQKHNGDSEGNRLVSPSTGGKELSLKVFIGVFTALTVLYVLSCMAMIYLGFAVARIRASYTLHRDLISKIFRLPSAFFDTTPLGRIINRLSSDLQGVDDRLPWAIDEVLYWGIRLIASIIIIAVSTPNFLIALPVFVIIVVVIQKYYLAAMRAVKRIFHVSKSPIFQHFNETLGGVTTIRAMGVQERFKDVNNELLLTHVNAHVAFSYCIRWVEVRLQCLSAFVILLVAVGFVISAGQNMDPATAGLVLSFTLSITQEINYLVRNYCETQHLLVSVERMCEYTDMETEAPETLPLAPRLEALWPPQHGAIEFDNYSTRYREGMELVLRNISFKVEAGEKIGIVGRTGAGKSSLTLALFRMIEAANGPWVHSKMDAGITEGEVEEVEAGRIVIDGVDIAKLGLTSLRRALAIIPQDPVLFAGTIRENLDPFQEHSDADLWEALGRAHLKDHIQTLQGGLSFEVTTNGENFSVGQRSLICLGRALLRKTKILVLDEATSAVDIETDELIQNTIREEFKDRTLLTIAHRIKTVMDSDKILVLEQGRVVEFGSPQMLLSRKDESLFYRLAEQAGEV